jgi:hypothetical protein
MLTGTEQQSTILLSIEEQSYFSGDELRRLYYGLLDQTIAIIRVIRPSMFDFFTHGRFMFLPDQQGITIFNSRDITDILETVRLFICANPAGLKLAAGTQTRTLGIWPDLQSMIQNAVPRSHQCNVVLTVPELPITPTDRIRLNAIECFDRLGLLETVLKCTTRMIAPSRYLFPNQSGPDTQLQRFVLDWQGRRSTRFIAHDRVTRVSSFNDRHVSFDLLLRMLVARFSCPNIVETGCIREQDNFRGDGYSTLIFARIAASVGGRLTSIEIDATRCDFARQQLQPFQSSVEIVCSDSVAWLRSNSRSISVLYLDSMDTQLPQSAEHGLNEIKAAYNMLDENAIVVYDDTIWNSGNCFGKGSLAVPWLLSRGWEIVYSGYQTILQRQSKQ